MYFLINTRHRIAFGWSAKCGCTMVKSLFFQLSGIFMPHVHGAWLWAGLPADGGGLEIVVFARNPYERVVSGFIDKYGRSRELVHSDPIPGGDACCFADFVRSIETHGIDQRSANFVHHFTPQLSEAWIDGIPVTRVFDIGAIDFDFLEQRFGTPVVDRHARANPGVPQRGVHIGAGLIPVGELASMSAVPNYASFYDRATKDAVSRLYARDLEFFRRFGLEYDIAV